VVRDAARGSIQDYRRDPAPITGGQADVFKAVHKGSGVQVAVKKVRGPGFQGSGTARMRREIEVGRRLEGIRAVMPILDASDAHDWFVMPWATATLESRRVSVGAHEQKLLRLVKFLCSALAPAHENDWIHRDIKPSNVLLLSDGVKGIWVLADWGLVRRPRGQTSRPGRTRVGEGFGTLGFAAPELDDDAHSATPAADIYSMGQLIGWTLTGTMPRPNIANLPASGPWRPVVATATRYEAVGRPQSIAELLEVIRVEVESSPPDDWSRLKAIAGDAATGSREASIELLRHSRRHPEDYELHVDLLPKIPHQMWFRLIDEDADAVSSVVDAMVRFQDYDRGSRAFSWAAGVIRCLFDIASAAEKGHRRLYESAVEALFAWDAEWDQWSVQKVIVGWMRGLTGESARIVARALRTHGDVRHFAQVDRPRELDSAIRAAIFG
jgi:serine/threonine protein kinase